MVKWVETRSWEQALYSIVPKRKFQAGKRNIGISGGSVAETVQEVPGDSSEL
jgi:tRNA (guanine9-N1)-methyltransferase